MTFPIFEFLLFSLKLNAERRLGTPKAPTELAASAVWWGGGPHLWGPPGGVPGGSALAGRRPARVLLGGLAQWGD